MLSEMQTQPKKNFHDIDDTLERSLSSKWDAKLVDYDVEAYPFDKWMLGRIQAMGYPLEDLSNLHNVVPDGEAYKISKRLCADTNLPEFRHMLNKFVRNVVVPKGDLQLPVGVQRFVNVRIMLPNKPESIFPFHTGLLYGHGIASRSLWMPLTDVSAPESYTASMQIIGIERSRELVQEAIDRRLSVDEMTELFRKESWPLPAKAGKICFFTQENIHGNFVNVTGKTRVSIDFRIAEARYGDLLARKIPAGYFHLIPETDAEEDAAPPAPASDAYVNGKRNIFYVNNNSSSTFGVPVHLQRYMLLDYCKSKNLNYEFELFELEDMAHLPTLNYIVNTLKSNVVTYSIFSLPEDEADRNKLLDQAVQNGLIIHFVNEDIVLKTPEDLEMTKNYLRFAKYGNSRMPIGLPLSNRSKAMFANWMSH